MSAHLQQDDLPTIITYEIIIAITNFGPSRGCRVQGSGCRVQGSGSGLGSRVQSRPHNEVVSCDICFAFLCSSASRSAALAARSGKRFPAARGLLQPVQRQRPHRLARPAAGLQPLRGSQAYSAEEKKAKQQQWNADMAKHWRVDTTARGDRLRRQRRLPHHRQRLRRL